jgi:hypothetical protein
MDNTSNNEFFLFGEALLRLSQGKLVARRGWNGKGMFLLKAGDYKITPDKLRPGTTITPEFLQSEGVDSMDIRPHVDMWTAQKTYISGWVPSQTDMFANDWYEVKR